MILSQVLTVLATSLAAILIARNLDPDDWGIFSAYLGLSFALAVFVEFGLATWLLRELSRLFAGDTGAAEPRAAALMGAAIYSTVGLTAAVVVLGTAASAIQGEPASMELALSLLLLYGGLFASANVLEAYLRAHRRLRRVVTASIFEKYVLLTLLLMAAGSGISVWEVGIAYAIAGVLRLSLLGVSIFGRRLPPWPGLSYVRGLWRKSLPFALTSGAVTVVPQLDALVLLALSATAAGYFALGIRVLGPAVVAAAIGATTLYPFLARGAHRASAIWMFALAFAICGAVLAVVGIMLTPTLLPTIFGDQYASAVRPVQLMLLVLPLVYAVNPLLTYSFSCGRERAVLVTSLSAALIGTGAIVVGQALAGPSGAAVGLLFRQLLLFGAIASIAFVAGRSRPAFLYAPVSPSAGAHLG